MIIFCVQESKGNKGVWDGIKNFILGKDFYMEWKVKVYNSRWKNKRSVVEKNDRVITTKFMLEDEILNTASVNIPQVGGCEENQNKKFRQDMNEVKQRISRIEDIVLGVNMKRYIGIERTDNDRVREKFRFKGRN